MHALHSDEVIIGRFNLFSIRCNVSILCCLIKKRNSWNSKIILQIIDKYVESS